MKKSTLNPKVDAYIAKSAEFAQPILTYLRDLIHNTCTDVDEDIKWGTPHYAYKGDHLCMMAGFKAHCSFSLYKAEMMKDKAILDSVKAGKKFGFMDKVKSIDELPDREVLVAYIQEAMKINESGMNKVKPIAAPKVVEIPNFFAKALQADDKANKVFKAKSDAFRKEYIIWISDAKTEETRQKRMAQSLEWIAEGKGRFWQYKK